MQSVDFLALSPLSILSVTILVVLLQIALHRSHAASVILTLTGLLVAFCAIVPAAPYHPVQVTVLFTMDLFGLFFIALILAATAGTVLLASGYLPHCNEPFGEFYLLCLIAALGACVLVISRHFAAFFLGLEILSIALYAMVAYPRRRLESLEAGIKYLILAAAASAFVLFGMALVYMQTGGLDFNSLVMHLRQPIGVTRPFLLSAGTAMLVVGFAFKLALVPFHMWTADVYQGAPAPTTAFVATVSKISVAALMLRLFLPLQPADHAWLYQPLGLLAIAAMVGGNLLALYQRHVKRILAYSSIAHLGYLMVAFIAGGSNAITAVSIYLLAYGLSIMGCFAVISALSNADGDADQLTDFHGLCYRRPWIGAFFTVMLLSLAGIPLTAGFIGKYLAVNTGAGEGLWWLVITLVITSGIGLFYYLRIVVILFGQGEAQIKTADAPRRAVDLATALVLTLTTAILVLLGIVPGGVIAFVRQALSLGGIS